MKNKRIIPYVGTDDSFTVVYNQLTDTELYTNEQIISDANKTILKLQAENEKLKEALRFYAKKEEWCSEGQGDVEIISCQDLEEVGSHLIGGKLARKTLREVEGE